MGELPFTHRKQRCSRCEEWRDRSEFYPVKKGELAYPAKLQSQCKPCYKATYTTDYRKNLKLTKGARASENK